MQEWASKVLEQIPEVTRDMSGNYKLLVKKICANAVITIDRFHVTKMPYEELNKARIDKKKAARSLNFKERGKLFGSLKASKYIVLKAEPISSRKNSKIITSKISFTSRKNHALLKKIFHALF
jgi:transposase